MRVIDLKIEKTAYTMHELVLDQHENIPGAFDVIGPDGHPFTLEHGMFICAPVDNQGWSPVRISYGDRHRKSVIERCDSVLVHVDWRWTGEKKEEDNGA